MRVLITGGRDWSDDVLLRASLDKVLAKHGYFWLASGACPTGADAMAEQWAKDNEIPYMGVPARWKMHGKAAGPIRNKDMIHMVDPHAAVAFKGGTGTAGMVRLLEPAKVPVWKVGF